MTAARHAVSADLATLEMSLAKAFADDPMVSWVTGEADLDRRLTVSAAGFFRPSLATGLKRGHVYTVDSLGGAAIWAPPDVAMFDDAEGSAFASALHGQAGDAAIERIISLSTMVDSHHPHDQPHFYLFVIGSAEQGRGLGARLLQPVLDRCDADGLPAYLESSTARNLGFYERHGFRVTWEDRPAPDGPVFRGMWREPRI